MRKRARLIIGITAIVLAAVGGLIAMSRNRSVAGSDSIPTTEVTRGDLGIEVHATGELNATQSIMLAAPAVGGDSLQITRLSLTGDQVHKGDVVIEFDPSEQRYKLEQSHSELLQAEQEIVKANADAEVLAAKDKVDLLKARYDVRRAELEVGKNELKSKIDAQKNELLLQGAKRALAQLEKDVESHHASGQAAVFLAKEKYNKAKLAMDQAQQNLDHMKVTSPMDGLVSVQKNMSTGIMFPGMSLADFHSGDQVQPGTSILQVLNPANLNLVARIPEDQHSNVQLAEPVTVRFDALPGREFKGTVKIVGGMSVAVIFGGPSMRGSDVTMQLLENDSRLRPGLTAEVVFHGQQQHAVLSAPRQALFMKDGKRVVFVKKGGSYVQQVVTVKGESESRVMIEGVPEGASLALLDPTIPQKTSGSSAAGTGAI
ncbi:MAG: efflux RND transporter periplasmic adaptor subunit [Acidobacteria bacterium]|nr:efflux RND transporter periplasmic adaptor subunit [Acidobacteriota bacterium]